MSRTCANLSTAALRLATAQRAFFLAWKAVEAGDRTRLHEARRLGRQLEDARTEILRAIWPAWDDKTLDASDPPVIGFGYRMTEEHFANGSPQRAIHIGRDDESMIYAIGTDPFVTLRDLHRKSPRADTYGFAHNNMTMESPSSLQVLPDRRIVTGGEDGYVRVWKFEFGEGREQLLASLRHNDYVGTVRVLPDETIVSGCADGTIWIWKKTDDGYRCEQQLLERTPWMGVGITSLHVPYDGRLIAGSGDGSVFVFKTNDEGRYVRTAHIPHPERVALNVVTAVQGLAGGRIVIGHKHGLIRVHQEMQDESYFFKFQMLLSRMSVLDMHVLLDGTIVVVGSLPEIDVYVPDRDGYRLRQVISMPWIGTRVQVLKSGRIAVGHQDGHVRIYDWDREQPSRV